MIIDVHHLALFRFYLALLPFYLALLSTLTNQPKFRFARLAPISTNFRLYSYRKQ